MPTSRSNTSATEQTGPGSLTGASVIVTRPTSTARSLLRQIRRLGGEAIALPGSALRPATDPDQTRVALQAAARYDAAVFVSPTAVGFAFRLCPGLRFQRDCAICAVGAATARALHRHGVAEVHWPRSRQDSEGLLALPELTRLRDCHVALIGAPGGRELLAESLRREGAHVQAIHVYRRAPPRYTQRSLRRLEQAYRPLITLLSSTEALVNLHALLPAALFARLTEGELIVSSQRLAALARERHFTHVHRAASPAPADLIATSIAVLAGHRL